MLAETVASIVYNAPKSMLRSSPGHVLGFPGNLSMARTAWTPKISSPFRPSTLVLCTCSPAILSMYTADFLISQLFPDEVEYFPAVSDNFATNAIGDGGKWVAVHSNTATL